ncbi:MAG: sporulation initiation factor Spo0A C-terminal domain-containing protein, partial [Bacilli bacterium]|nr:sporulation initiation factor Spo0A C-terminal domain-containing protein [Bacilli bacterium]
IYKELADINHTTIQRVERTIRHAVELCFSRGDIDLLEKIFGNTLSLSKSKPTNKEFIITLAERLNSYN